MKRVLKTYQLELEVCGPVYVGSGMEIQFSHTIEEQVGGLLQAGFRLTHLYEDTNGEGNLHEHGIPTFLALRATKEK